MRWNTVLFWGVILVTTGIAAVAARDMILPGQSLTDNNNHFFSMSEKEILFNSIAEKANGKTCEEAGGKCMWKKTINKMCKGKINKKSKCNKKNELCCISDITTTRPPTTFPNIAPTTKPATKVNQCVGEERENSILWHKIDSAETAVITTINKGNNNVTGALEIKIVNLEVELHYMKSELKSMKDNLSDVNSKLDYLINHLASSCPGFIRLEGSSQCFKLFQFKRVSWEEAKSLCESNGLQLAEPADDIAVELRKYLLDMHGDAYAWLGARGDGSSFRWQRNGGVLPNDSPLWWPGEPGSKVSCLTLLVYDRNWKAEPTHPYYANTCTDPRFPLCERVVN